MVYCSCFFGMGRIDSLLKPGRKSAWAADVSRPLMLGSGIDLTFAHAFAHATVPLVFTFFRVDTACLTFPYNRVALILTYPFLFHLYAPSGCLLAYINVSCLPHFQFQLIECPDAFADFFAGLTEL
jgi:hypothetical protein